jgi:hypothetical protein
MHGTRKRARSRRNSGSICKYDHEFIQETNQDLELSNVRKMILNKPTTTIKVSPVFNTFLHELTITQDGIVLRDNRIVVPQSLRKRIAYQEKTLFLGNKEG